ncbi:TetR/AcrR family transcriptional regulator [Moheibacter stercoris]|uniref:AcrR family transcriptional regulator n=1 Tax=Moheibacter stercoris TaxID=1628251 RepID=A0ABV2LSV0_9FLAO
MKKDETEEIIKSTAKRLFFVEGKFNATTQEIADAAGVNRTLINYYFRSRDNLFNMIFEDAIKKEDEQRENILKSDLPFKQKIEKYIDDSFKLGNEFPYLETYIVSRINDGCYYQNEEDYHRFIKAFNYEFEKEVKAGNIEEMDPIQFIFNIASLVSFPFAVRPLLQKSMRLDDKEFERIINERKEVIMKILFKK